MFEKYGAKIEKVRERIMGPRRIEFENGIDLVVRLSTKEPELKFMQNGKTVLDLRSMIPPDVKLAFDKNGQWNVQSDFKGGDVTLNIGSFKGPDFLLSYFHEAGHIYDPAGSEIAGDFRGNSEIERIKDMKNSFPPSRRKAIKESRDMIIRTERDAWAYSLRMVRKLEKDLGIKIFRKFGSTENVRQYINKCLDTHEQYYLNELRDCDVFSKEEMQELFERWDTKEAA